MCRNQTREPTRWRSGKRQAPPADSKGIALTVKVRCCCPPRPANERAGIFRMTLALMVHCGMGARQAEDGWQG